MLLLGILLGLFGALYNWCTAKAQDLFDKIRVPYIKTALPFLAAGLLGFVYPAALGGGHGLISQASSGLAIQALALLLLVRFCFSLFSFGSGAPGGIFLPLLVLGGVSGSLFGTAAQTARPVASPGEFCDPWYGWLFRGGCARPGDRDPPYL